MFRDTSFFVIPGALPHHSVHQQDRPPDPGTEAPASGRILQAKAHRGRNKRAAKVRTIWHINFELYN